MKPNTADRVEQQQAKQVHKHNAHACERNFEPGSEWMSEIISLEDPGYLVKCRKGQDLFRFELKCRMADFVDAM